MVRFEGQVFRVLEHFTVFIINLMLLQTSRRADVGHAWASYI
jgi:hypothetical protein